MKTQSVESDKTSKVTKCWKWQISTNTTLHFPSFFHAARYLAQDAHNLAQDACNQAQDACNQAQDARNLAQDARTTVSVA